LETEALRTLDRRAHQIDTLIIAGGPEATVLALRSDRKLLEWISKTHPHVRRTCSVCTGAFLLAEAGLLKGRRAATHWFSCEQLKKLYSGVRVESEPIFVRDGSVWTSAGVTAGIDLALALVEQDLGRGIALTVARWLVVFLKRPGGQSQFSAPLEGQIASAECSFSQRLAALHAWIANNLDSDLTVEHLASKVGMSARTFARAYRVATGLTPAKAVERMRVEAACRALENEEPVKRVASACGFRDYERMRRAFHRRFRIAPQVYAERCKSGLNVQKL
jgi:transcriptional regulator GlxA family with amidase domain